MGIKDFFTKTIIQEKVIHDSDTNHSSSRTVGRNGKPKYGNINYIDSKYRNYSQQRVNAKGIYEDSLIARGLVGRLVDNVINTGLTWESSPLWAMIPDWKNKSDEDKYDWTETVENYFTLYTDSKEADVKGRLTFKQIQRLLYLLRVKEGEYFCILRYLNDTSRTSNIAIQILNNDQVQQPYSADILKSIKSRGGTVNEGIEYDSTGKMIAIYVNEKPEEFSQKSLKRITVRGPRSGRLFVIHDANFEAAEQYRGFPELAAFIYELDRLTEYDINELEATVTGAMFFAAIETEKGAQAKGPIIKTATGNTSSSTDIAGGIKNVNVDNKSLLVQNLAPGQKLKGFQPNRPNSNFAAFEEVFENRISGALGMPLSVFRQKFQASYSAARAEILFFWNNIFKRRDDFTAGFLNPFYEAWFTEHVNAGNFTAPGFKTIPIAKRAWLYGSWNGISRPVVDPVKEVKAVADRQKLGHTTGEREAKAYNGSDFRENVKRLANENEFVANANMPIDPKLRPEAEQEGNETGNVDPNGIDFETLKSEFDAYGVGVRAGAITPSPEDEIHFREIAGFPAMTAEAKKYWDDEGNVRRPITLAMPGILEDDLDTLEDESKGDDEKENDSDLETTEDKK